MDYRRLAAGRILQSDPLNERARSSFDDSNKPYSPAFVPEQDVPRDLAGYQFSVGRIEVKYKDGWWPLGTGWAVSASAGERLPSTRFMTCAHLLQGVRESEFNMTDAGDIGEFRDGRIALRAPDDGRERLYPIRRWICAHPWDAAVFEVEFSDEEAPLGLILSRTAAVRGDRIAYLGYPLYPSAYFSHIDRDYSGKLFIGSGEVMQVFDESIEHNASTVPGCSGSPVLDVGTGEVVGLHCQGSTGGMEQVFYKKGFGNWALRIDALCDGWLGDILSERADAPPAGTSGGAWYGGLEPTLKTLSEGMFPQIVMPSLLPWAADGAGVLPDRADSRDQIYQPRLIPVPPATTTLPNLPIGNQRHEGSCAAFAVAAAIEHQLSRASRSEPGDRQFTASIRMLDRMARGYDEWLDDAGDGTSLRAVLKGFYHNGVCLEKNSPYYPGRPDFFLTRALAREARDLTLGAYQRVPLVLDDLRRAVEELGAVIVSAEVHDGWDQAKDGVITYDPLAPPENPPRRHAFLIVGYDTDGFIIQNSRGPSWGGYMDRGQQYPGLARWTYEDWAANCCDAWVIRLAPKGAGAFLTAARGGAPLAGRSRQALLGHMLYAERGGLVEDGSQGLGARGVAETAAWLARNEARKKYRELLILFHDPLTPRETIEASALVMTPRLKRLGIYPVHVMQGMDELLGLRLRISAQIAEAAMRYLREGGSRDVALERQLRPAILSQVESYRQGLSAAIGQFTGPALAALPLAQPKEDGLPIRVIGAGLGLLPAAVLARRIREFDPPSLSIAAPVRSPVRRWLLDAEARDESDLPGLSGSWGDLIAGAQGISIRTNRNGAKAATLSALLSAPDFANQLVNRLGPRTC